MSDPRIQKLIEAIQSMSQGQFDVPSIDEGDDEVARLGRGVRQLADYLYNELAQQEILSLVVEKINQGLTLDEVLDYAYDALRPVIPFDRIGFSLLTDDGKNVTSVWVRGENVNVQLAIGYVAPLAGSSLARIIATGEPRILNDLEKYLQEKPDSRSTRLIVSEGLRSSLTCPLIAMGKPIGFMFFTSRRPQAYQHAHVNLFLRIARPFSLIAEKSRLYQRVVELNDVKNKFLGMAAHDLRTPIAVIKGHLDLFTDLLIGDMTEAQEKSVKMMTGLCGKMLGMIDAFLDISAIESGQLNLKKKAVALPEYLRSVVDMNLAVAEKKAIELRLDCAPDLPPVALDPDRLAQVINNLISNAIKFSPTNTVVVVAARREPYGVYVSVKDQGPGIPQAEIVKIFAYFGRTSTRPTGGESSTGLGLMIAKKIVEAHGGSICVENSPGKGATFFFVLPLLEKNSGA